LKSRVSCCGLELERLLAAGFDLPLPAAFFASA
jgi:hypothetical protein